MPPLWLYRYLFTLSISQFIIETLKIRKQKLLPIENKIRLLTIHRSWHFYWLFSIWWQFRKNGGKKNKKNFFPLLDVHLSTCSHKPQPAVTFRWGYEPLRFFFFFPPILIFIINFSFFFNPRKLRCPFGKLTVTIIFEFQIKWGASTLN